MWVKNTNTHPPDSSATKTAWTHARVFVCQTEQERGETEPLLQSSTPVDTTVNGEITAEPLEAGEEHTEAISFCGALRIPVSGNNRL